MAISFDSIPSAFRIPIVLNEFDSTRAQQGPSIQQYKALLLGNKTSGGSATANTPVRITSKSQAIEKFGDGSILAIMAEYFLKNNSITPLYCLPVDDAGGGVSATGKLTVAAGTATAAGTVYLYVAGRRITTAVVVGDDQDAVATAIVAAIGAYTDEQLPITAAVNGVNANEVDITAKNDGVTGNDIDLRFNYNSGEEFPAGISITVTGMASGATNPTLTTAISNFGDEQYNVLACPWDDDTSLDALEAELSDRWGVLENNDGVLFAAQKDAHGDLLTAGAARNSQFSCLVGEVSPVSSPWEYAASIAGQVALAGQIDPGRPFQTLELKGILPPSAGDRMTLTERNQLLYSGISTTLVDSGGKVLIERLITTYQTDSAGNPDEAFLDVNTLLILSYLRYDTRNRFSSRYPRFKLANNGTAIAPGQAIVTPEIIEAEFLSLFRGWQELGLVEGEAQFKEDMVVERNISDVNRVDALISPDVINQFRYLAIKTAFLR